MRISISALILLVLVHCASFGAPLDTISSTKSVKDAEVITSTSDVFRLGFFSLANSTNRYVGIWYSKGIPEESVIWVANRDKPLKDDSGVVMISEDGNLVVLNGQKEVLWSTNVYNPVANVNAQLLDSGNLVLQENNSTNGVRLWESFQQLSNAFVPTMKLSTNVRTGEKLQLRSWKSLFDPSNGSFFIGVGIFGLPQLFNWNNTMPYWRSGPWNGQKLIGIRYQRSYSALLDRVNLVDDRDKDGSVYLTFAGGDVFSYFLLDPQGNLTRRIWDDGKRDWIVWWSPIVTECDIYGKCGPFGSCNSEKPSICSCLRGFEPRNIEEWSRGNWTSGCMRIKPLQCERINSGNETGKEDGFLKLKRTKVPDFPEGSISLEDKCEEQCLSNCSCTAYAYDSGIGCMTWSQNLVDIEEFSDGGIDLYIRLAHSELEKKTNIQRIIISTLVIGIVLIAISTFFLWRRMAKHRAMEIKTEEEPMCRIREEHAQCLSPDRVDEDKLQQQLPVFKIEELASATDNFNPSNKLGQGGFGPVYKGTLKDGQQIAVKRLSRASGQGFEEFMNEVLVISKLQHRNLVRLLGCCVEGEEKMLVYEYMPNKSLDSFIFDPTKQELLDWKKRFNIIEGISRGLLYLHRDSRLRIIHRDLKASNILLDEEMNPKISDFGMARIFGGNENQANTRRVVGTYGYMAPEYAMEGHFSEKSDVFSYGVLLLEIISGRRNTSFYNKEHPLSLLRYAWRLWNEGNSLALQDKVVSDPCHRQEILRCIQVGLLCVEESAKDRPNISAVISMLNSEIVNLPMPKQPAFTDRHDTSDTESSQYYQNSYSINKVTLTNVEGR